MLFSAAADTLIDVCRSHLGATPGIIAVLHTWNQLLEHHVHIHCIASGGGLSLDGQRWISSRANFFLPVRNLSQVFRGKLLQAFERALMQRRLHMSEQAGRALLRRAAAQNFVVYSKPPMAGPEQVLRYLGRYTHRIARTKDGEILSASGGVTSCMDTSDGLAMSVHELARRSGVGFKDDGGALPVHSDAIRIGERLGLDAMDWALNSGGDYQLLFTLSPEGEGRLRSMLGRSFTVIGEAIREGVLLEYGKRSTFLEDKGFEHLRC